MPSGQPRWVGVKARDLVHAVWVPHDLPAQMFTFERILRDDMAPLVRSNPYWSGQAACKQLMRGVVAGEQGGHDWDRFPERDKCPRCIKVVARG